ncbi:hypothetical protein AAMO2058_001733100, partial [Amorphochlora amoebiformis]
GQSRGYSVSSDDDNAIIRTAAMTVVSAGGPSTGSSMGSSQKNPTVSTTSEKSPHRSGAGRPQSRSRPTTVTRSNTTTSRVSRESSVSRAQIVRRATSTRSNVNGQDSVAQLPRTTAQNFSSESSESSPEDISQRHRGCKTRVHKDAKHVSTKMQNTCPQRCVHKDAKHVYTKMQTGVHLLALRHQNSYHSRMPRRITVVRA